MGAQYCILVIGLAITIVLLCNQILATSVGTVYVVNITCPDGWVKAMNNCYYFNTQDQVTWSEARTECNIRNSDLLFIANSEEKEWVALQTEEYRTDEWWVGLSYSTIKKAWHWVQAGGDISAINWRHEPDNYDGQDCCAINEFGSFSDEYCNTKLGFICQLPLKRGEICDTTNRWLMSNTHCYYISPLINVSLQLTWNDAKTYCSNLKPGKTAQLLSIKTPEEKTTINSLLQTYDTSRVLLPWWTGMNDLAAEGNYFWQDGTNVNMSFINWDQAPSSDRSKSRDCGVMYQGGVIDDTTCDKRAHYACETTAYSGYLDFGCGSWLRAGSKCYLMSTADGYSWSQARDSCSRANGQLLKVDNLDEMFWLQTLYIRESGYWTGLSKRSGTGSWLWADGSIPNHSLVAWVHEPNNYHGNENCASISRLGLYNDDTCTSKLGYICEYTKNTGVDCARGWLSRGSSSCYYISSGNKNDSVTWFEAKDRCNDLVASVNLIAYRLAVNSKDEQAWIQAELLNQPVSSPFYWTGLNDRTTQGLWQYDEDFNNPPNKLVINWSVEPNNLNGFEDCAMLIDGGVFSDRNCQYQARFICERPLQGSQRQQQSHARGNKPIHWMLLVVISSVYHK